MGSVAIIFAGLAAAVALYVFVVEPLWVLPLLEWLTPGILYRVKTEKALVALSFDDGPHEVYTPQVLEILEKYEAKATFFLIGERAERNPELVWRIWDAGHEVGNHYWKDGTTLGDSRATFGEKREATERAIGLDGSGQREENDLTQRAQRIKHREHEESSLLQKVGPKREARDSGSQTWKQTEAKPGIAIDEKTCTLETGGCGTPDEGETAKAASSRRTPKGPIRFFFRPPGGVAWPWQLRLARERGYLCVLGCAYPHDPMRPPVRYMRWLIEKNLRPGTIVILHDGIRDARKSIELLPQILQCGKQRGLRFVSIGELRDSRGQELWRE